jgi:hypothetical protein
MREPDINSVMGDSPEDNFEVSGELQKKILREVENKV